MSEEQLGSKRVQKAGAILFGGIGLLVAADIASDYEEGAGFWHLFFESLTLLMAVVGLFVLLRRLWALLQEKSQLTGQLNKAREEAERWRNETREILEGLGSAIDRQFERWSLTRAEREVGLLLLKGLSFKEIAAVRDVSERTAREQARAVYRKAELGGRAELSAFFLEDLLLPQEKP